MSSYQRSQVNLDNCDKEPIHFIGSVQSHGCLLVVDAGGRLRHHSQNASEFLGELPASLDSHGLLGELWRRSSETVDRADLQDRPLYLGVVQAGEPLHVTAHRRGESTVFEFEPATARERSLTHDFHRLLLRLGQQTELQTFVRSLVEGLRELSGVDRVMLYRFLPDWAGEVIAESKADHVAVSYLGLRFPSYDIPEPARRLFSMIWVRTIPQAAAAESPIVSVDGAPSENVDLSYAVLRGVSPMHVEYLDNMGVRGTLTISIRLRGRLWGLIACHHYSAYELEPAGRASFEVLGQLASAYLGRLLEEQRSRLAEQNREMLDRCAQALTSSDANAQLDATRSLLLCDGVLVLRNSLPFHSGITPTDDEGLKLLDLLDRDERMVVAWDGIPDYHPESLSWSEPLRGVARLRLNGEFCDSVLWFRTETERHVKWGGRPDSKVVKVGPQGPRLHPRSSFEEYLETTRGRSIPWSQDELELLRILGEQVRILTARRVRALESANARLEEINQELDAFTRIASHDLKEPLRGIHNYATYLSEDYGEELPEEAGYMVQRIKTLSRRMDLLLNSLLGLSHVTKTSIDLDSVVLRDLVDDAVDLLGERPRECEAHFEYENLDLTVVVQPTFITQILSNLLSNAMKYGGERPRVRVSAKILERSSDLVFEVQDWGCGVEESLRDSIFDLFIRGSTDRQGFGIGLHIVKRLCERLGGRVEVDSEVGLGSTFRVILPQASQGN